MSTITYSYRAHNGKLHTETQSIELVQRRLAMLKELRADTIKNMPTHYGITDHDYDAEIEAIEAALPKREVMPAKPYTQVGSSIWQGNKKITEIRHDGSPQGIADAVGTAAEFVRACNAHDDLVRELQAAEKIILAMLNTMTLEQKTQVAAKLADAGVSDEGMTRFHERRAALEKAGVKP